MKYKTRITELTIVPNGHKLYSERATQIRIEDESAGEFIQVLQPSNDDKGVRFDPEEWPHVAAAIGKLVKECQ